MYLKRALGLKEIPKEILKWIEENKK